MSAVRLQSRIGNVVLACIGAADVIAASALLAWFISTSWHWAELSDRAVQMLLAASAAAGVYFTVSALRNLGVSGLPASRARRTRAAVAS